MVSKTAEIWAYGFNDSTLAALNPAGSWNAANSCWRDPSYLPGPDMLFVPGDSSSNLYDCEANAWAILPTIRSAGMRAISGSNSAGTFDPNRNLVISMNTSWQGLQVNVMRVDTDSLISGFHKGAGNRPAIAALSASPNPFNPVATINLPHPGARVSIYDISGKRVADFGAVPGNKALWNASGHPSGVYVIEAVYRAKTSVKLITLMR
jgi:hypothetical protein